MTKTDYSKIANKYDNNKFRNQIKPDNILNSIVVNNNSNIDVLDLACGTGLYLKKQIEVFTQKEISWYGIDSSEEMLSKSRLISDKIDFRKCSADELPFSDNKFDYIISNYAFQHFDNKSAVLDEIQRVLNNDGILNLHNTAIHEMKNWWVYKYFQKAYFEDLKRYWQNELIFSELSSRGFIVEIDMKYKMQYIRLIDLIDYVQNRDISVLTLINDKDYQDGYNKMQDEIRKNKDVSIYCDFAEVNFIARKI